MSVPQANVEIYSPEKVRDEKYDAIVIGSGIGGLSVASLLAQAKKKVIVLEQHNVAGGSCHTFTSNGYEWCVGIHYLAKMQDGSDYREILDALTPAGDPIEWDDVGDVVEMNFFGDPPMEFDFVKGEEAFKQKLIERFKEEEEAIEKYFKAVKKSEAAFERAILFKSLPLAVSTFLTSTGLYKMMDGGYHKMVKRSLEEKLNKWTKNKDLQSVLAADFPCYGTDPKRAPFLFQPLMTSSYGKGSYYPRGGPSVIPNKVIRSIAADGGKVLVSAPVECIVVDEKTSKAKGVKLQDGTLLESDVVISDTGLINTATKLLPHGLIDIDFADVGAGEHQFHPSVTAVSLFVGLQGDSQSLNLPKTVGFIHASNDFSATFEKLRGMSLEEALELEPKEFGPIFFSLTSAADSTWTKRYPGKTAMQVIALAQWHWFEKFQFSFDGKTKSHGTEYETAKARIAEKLWEMVVQALEPTGAKLPQNLDDVDHYKVATPLTFVQYLKSYHGGFYGLDNDMKRFAPKTFFLRLRPEVPEVPGLYLTGQDVTTDGVMGAAMGGVLCASKVLGVSNPKVLVNRSKERQAPKKEIEEKKMPAEVSEQALQAEVSEQAIPDELIELTA